MMSNPALAEDQLMELLLQLKKTTPDAARAILNSQPQIAYALITLMVNMNAINVDVLHKTVAAYGAQAQLPPPPQVQAPAPFAPVPQPAIPGHLQAQYRTSTPPSMHPSPATMYSYSNGHPPPPLPAFAPTHQVPGYSQTPPVLPVYPHGSTPPIAYPGYPQPYVAPPPPAQPPPALPEALASISDDQKAVIVRVLSMTPDQINQLPPSERSNIIQLRTTLGLPPI